ncbi:YciI family protein [Brevibacillus ginsengisoli]|uniref:YciI family protein n=1 Tax=Brevibacillus ginsengisoli TaxID=363854 RepID=UPI003CF9DC77
MENQKQQFIYVLKPCQRLLDNTCTKEDEQIIHNHFQYLQQLSQEGKVVLAGRTLVMDESTFGIVILEVDEEEEGRSIMENDPAIKYNLMTSSFYPYHIAIIRG